MVEVAVVTAVVVVVVFTVELITVDISYVVDYGYTHVYLWVYTSSLCD